MKPITIPIISSIASDTSWSSKMQGCILVESADQIDPLFELLCEQDSYWRSYKHIISIIPTSISSLKDLRILCDYGGNTDIYEFDLIQSKIPFFSYQYFGEYE